MAVGWGQKSPNRSRTGLSHCGDVQKWLFDFCALRDLSRQRGKKKKGSRCSRIRCPHYRTLLSFSGSLLWMPKLQSFSPGREAHGRAWCCPEQRWVSGALKTPRTLRRKSVCESSRRTHSERKTHKLLPPRGGRGEEVREREKEDGMRMEKKGGDRWRGGDGTKRGWEQQSGPPTPAAATAGFGTPSYFLKLFHVATKPSNTQVRLCARARKTDRCKHLLHAGARWGLKLKTEPRAEENQTSQTFNRGSRDC